MGSSTGLGYDFRTCLKPTETADSSDHVNSASIKGYDGRESEDRYLTRIICE